MTRVGIVVGALTTAIALSGTANANTDNAVVLVNANTAQSEQFWTADRFAHARPLELPAANVAWSYSIESPPPSQVSAPSELPSLNVAPSSTPLFTPLPEEEESVPEMFGSSDLRFTSSLLVTNAVASLGGENTYPYRVTGRLFFSIPGGSASCSATVQTIGVITTAGHCVADGMGHLYSNWVFVPATRNGSAPFGTWTWKYVVVTSTWANGGGVVPNAQDVAVIVLMPNSHGVKIGSVTGWAGFNIPDLYAGQHLTTIGYPGNLDNAEIDHRNDAQAVSGTNNTDLIGSDMSHGASGGGWIVNYGEYASGEPPAGAADANPNSLVAVTSYGPTATAPLYLGASILDRRYVQCTPLNTCASRPTAILNIACVNNRGFC